MDFYFYFTDMIISYVRAKNANRVKSQVRSLKHLYTTLDRMSYGAQ